MMRLPAQKLETLIEEMRSGRLSATQLEVSQRALSGIEDTFDEKTADEEEITDGQEENERTEEQVLGSVLATSLADLEAELREVEGLLDLARRVYAIVPVDPFPTPLAPLDMILRFSEGRQFPVHLAKEPCSALVRELLMALVGLCNFGGTVNSPGRAELYTISIRKFVRFLAVRSSSQECTLTVSDLTPRDLETFEEHLRAQATHEESVSPYTWIGSIVRLLRWWRETHPERIPGPLQARLAYIANGSVGRHTSRDGYSGQITDALRAACLKDIPKVTERLTVQCDRQCASGGDPEVHGWENPHNVAWHIVHNGVIPAHTVARNRWYQASEGLEEVHARVFPTARDLVPFLVFLALTTDIAIESLKDLHTDCLQNPANGTVEIQYLKRRAHPQEWKTERVRDGGMTTPGRIIRLVLRLTQRARTHFETSHLWIAFGHGHLYLPRFPVTQENSPIMRFVADHDLRDEQGQPLTLQLLRLRKTRRAERYVLGHGQLEDVARGVHTLQVAGDHYADIPALRHVHEATIAQALEDALRQTSAHILSPAEEERLRGDPASAPLSLSVAPEQIEALLSGEQDAWMAGCANFYASPFGKQGSACPVPVWGCLECPNAVITSRHLPTILLFLNRMLAERERLEERAWTAQFGRAYARIVQQILPAFPLEVVTAARAMLEATTPVLALPPNLALLRQTP